MRRRIDSPQARPTLPRISDEERTGVLPLDVPHDDQVTTEARLNLLRRTAIVSTNKGIQTSSSASPTSIKNPASGYLCEECGECFKQPQGLTRHLLKHGGHRLCLYCDFEWTRPYTYGEHLKKYHPSADVEKVLGKPAGSRRRTTIQARDFRRHISPPAGEPDRRSEVEHLQRSVMPSLAASHIPAPALSPVLYDLQLEHAEPADSSRNREGAHGLSLHDITGTPFAYMSTEEADKLKEDIDGFIEEVQIG